MDLAQLGAGGGCHRLYSIFGYEVWGREVPQIRPSIVRRAARERTSGFGMGRRVEFGGENGGCAGSAASLLGLADERQRAVDARLTLDEARDFGSRINKAAVGGGGRKSAPGW